MLAIACWFSSSVYSGPKTLAATAGSEDAAGLCLPIGHCCGPRAVLASALGRPEGAPAAASGPCEAASGAATVAPGLLDVLGSCGSVTVATGLVKAASELAGTAPGLLASALGLIETAPMTKP